MYKIAVIPGDGTGPEVIREGLKVLEEVSAAEGITIDYTHYDLGGSYGQAKCFRTVCLRIAPV